MTRGVAEPEQEFRSRRRNKRRGVYIGVSTKRGGCLAPGTRSTQSRRLKSHRVLPRAITPQNEGGTVIAEFVSMKEENHMEHLANKSIAQRVGAGAAAGLAGSVVVQGLMAASQKWAPESLPPIRQDPGEFMVKKAGELLPEKVGEKIPEQLETAAAKLLGLGYGATFGALYASSRPEVQKLLLDGGALGLATWAAGYLGWLPAAGLMPPISEQEPRQIAGPIVSHILFGIATVGLYRLMHQRF
jgi:hypothetical protein